MLLTNHDKQNLGLADVDQNLNVTNLRLNKRGHIQYSTDKGVTWDNLSTAKKWINLFAGPMDDVDGDGSSDNILGNIEYLKSKLEESTGVKPEDLENILKRIDELEEITKDIQGIPDDQILALFGK